MLLYYNIMENFMDRDLSKLNERQEKTDLEKSKQFGLMDRTVNELILLWINTNRDMWIEAEKVFKTSIINKNKLGIREKTKDIFKKIRHIATRKNRLFFVGIDIILVGIILYMCKIGR